MIFGYDPEFMLRDIKTQRWVSAATVLPNGKVSKKARIAIDTSGGTGFLYRDGWAAEFNGPVNQCRGLLLTYFAQMVSRARTMLAKKGLELVPMPAVPVTKAVLAKQPEDVLEFGCAPSRNAYEGGKEVLRTPKNSAAHPWRYAGGHIHLSGYIHLGTGLADQVMLVKLLDYYLGVPFTALFDRPEQYRRRRYYGRAGEFRRKGPRYIEYRVLGPEAFAQMRWASLAFGIARACCYFFKELAAAYPKGKEDAIQEAINTGEGIWKVMPKALPKFYTADLIKYIAETDKAKFDFTMNSRQDGHNGWAHATRKVNAAAYKAFKAKMAKSFDTDDCAMGESFARSELYYSDKPLTLTA